MSKELELMTKLEALKEEAELSEDELQRAIDWFTDKYDPECQEKEAPDPGNPFERLEITMPTPGPSLPQPVLPVYLPPSPNTVDPAPWQTYQVWCSDHSGGPWATSCRTYTNNAK